MARSGRGRPGIAEGYGSATAADIARYGVYGKGGAGRPQPGVKRDRDGEPDAVQAVVVEEAVPEAAVGPVGQPATACDTSVGARTCAPDAPEGRITKVRSENLALSRRGRAGARPYGDGPEGGSGDERAHGGAAPGSAAALTTTGTLSLASTDALADEERRQLRRKVVVSMAVLVVLAFLSLGIFGAASSPYIGRYCVFSPLEVARVLADHAYNFVGSTTHLFPPKSTEIYSDPYLYYAIPDKAGVIGITLLCAVLLSVSGMLYQNVFKNPIAGPGMLGVSSGVTLGTTLIVYFYGVDAVARVSERYAICYGLGAAVLLFVVLAGRKLSGKGKPFDIVTMLLLGSILGQLVGFVVSYLTLFVMDPDIYQIYLTLSQMLVVDTSPISWAALGAACVLSLSPVLYLRFRFNALAFDEQEVRMLGINFTALRAVALVCGAIMILAAQIHIGAVAMVSLIVPFLSRSWFGCEFRKQLVGNVCISTILLLICRDIVDLIPFVGDGIGIGSAVSVIALPLFLLIMARHMRGWE